MAGVVFLWVFWGLAGACQWNGVGGLIAQFTIISTIHLLHKVMDGKPTHKRNAARAGEVFFCGESGFLGGKNTASS